MPAIDTHAGDFLSPSLLQGRHTAFGGQALISLNTRMALRISRGCSEHLYGGAPGPAAGSQTLDEAPPIVLGCQATLLGVYLCGPRVDYPSLL